MGSPYQVNTTLKNLKYFCKNERIRGYSRLKKFEIMKLLSDRINDARSKSIISFYINNLPTKELVGIYIALSNSKLKRCIAQKLRQLESAIVWNVISSYNILTKGFILDFLPFLNWSILSKNQCVMTEDMIATFSTHVNFEELSKRPNLPLNIIRRFKDQLNWYTLCQTQQFSETFLHEMVTDLHITNIDWSIVARNQRLSENFLTTHMAFICEHASYHHFWTVLAQRHVLSDDFILEHILELPWWALCQYQKLSTNIIVELINVVEQFYGSDQRFWDLISTYQKMPANLLRQYKNKVNWVLIVTNNVLDETTVLEFKAELNRSLVMQYQGHLNSDFLERHFSPYTKVLDSFFLCPICLEEIVENGVRTNICNHKFCKTCIDQSLAIKSSCPYCRTNLLS